MLAEPPFGLAQQIGQAVAGLVVVRVVGDDVHAESAESPLQRPTDSAEAAGRLKAASAAANPE